MTYWLNLHFIISRTIMVVREKFRRIEMKRHDKKQYDITHNAAKVINDVLLNIAIIGSAYFFSYGPFWAGAVCSIVSVQLFQHGNNAIAYLIEKIKGLKHLHKWY